MVGPRSTDVTSVAERTPVSVATEPSAAVLSTTAAVCVVETMHVSAVMVLPSATQSLMHATFAAATGQPVSIAMEYRMAVRPLISVLSVVAAMRAWTASACLMVVRCETDAMFAPETATAVLAAMGSSSAV